MKKFIVLIGLLLFSGMLFSPAEAGGIVSENTNFIKAGPKFSYEKQHKVYNRVMTARPVIYVNFGRPYFNGYHYGHHFGHPYGRCCMGCPSYRYHRF